MIARPLSATLLCLGLMLTPAAVFANEGNDARPHHSGAKFVKVKKAAADEAARKELKVAVSVAESTKPRKGRIWCVPFARQVTGIEIKGNAGTWWRQAKDKYARGHDPVVGAVMAFSSTRKLPMGHVAVVSQVVSDREILVDHANWSPSKVSLGMKVIDVSSTGDWSAVRVASNGSSLGRTYPMDGFIWNTSAE